MRRFLAWMLAAVLLSVIPAAVFAADDKLASVALVVQVPDNGENAGVRVVGMAVLAQTKDGETWIAPTAIVPTGEGGAPALATYLMTEDGLVAPVTAAQPFAAGGISALTVQGQLEPVAAPVAQNLGNPESQAVVGYLENGTLISGGATNLAPCALEDGSAGMTLTAMEGLKPGSATYDRDGRLTGMILASLGEGEGRYLAVGALTLSALLNDVPAPQAEDPVSSAADLLDTKIDGGYLYVTPRGMSTPSEQDAAVYYMDAGNGYYSWVVGEAGAKDLEFTLPAVPGRTLLVWFAAGGTEHGDAEFGELLKNQDPLVVEPPTASPIDRYDYKQDCYLAVERLGKVVGVTERLEPAEGVTGAMLTDASNKLYFQVNSTYTVTEIMSESLLICLYTPDGSCLTNIATFIWGTEYMARDDWHEDVTELFTYYAESCGGELPPGEYTLTYYIGADLAGSYTFVLSDGSLLDGGEEL